MTHERQGLTPEDLKKEWSLKAPQPVIGFYGETNEFGEFSNFFQHTHTFTIPEWCGTKRGICIDVEFSEKSIMLCKASLFDDNEAFEKIKVATTPHKAKMLGRTVKNFNEHIWSQYVCDIAFQAVYQKFKSNPSLIKVLLSTDSYLIAEAAPRDRLWGIGMNAYDKRLKVPRQWNGYNVLGHALMKTRKVLLENTCNQVTSIGL